MARWLNGKEWAGVRVLKAEEAAGLKVGTPEVPWGLELVGKGAFEGKGVSRA